LYLHMEASQHSLLAACFTLHSINATLAIVPQRGAGLWISSKYTNSSSDLRRISSPIQCPVGVNPSYRLSLYRHGTDHAENTSTVLLTACVCWTIYRAVAWQRTVTFATTMHSQLLSCNTRGRCLPSCCLAMS
jgi:hypothetical protein